MERVSPEPRERGFALLTEPRERGFALLTEPRERGFALLTEPRERGFALLIVLWSVVLLTLLATNMTASGRTEVQLAANLRGAAQAEAAADGAIYQAGYHLLDPTEPWLANRNAYTIDLPLDPVTAARVTIRIEDESGKINPNTATPELLQALLRAIGTDSRTSEQVPAAIADWRFPGSTPRTQGAKAPQYQAAGLAYAPPGAPFQSLDELGAVLGMTPLLLGQLRPHLSLFNDRDPSFATADPIVQTALRAAIGPPANPSGRPPPLRTVTLTAEAVTTTGARFIRRATLRLGATEKEPLLKIFDWQTPGD